MIGGHTRYLQIVHVGGQTPWLFRDLAEPQDIQRWAATKHLLCNNPRDAALDGETMRLLVHHIKPDSEHLLCLLMTDPDTSDTYEVRMGLFIEEIESRWPGLFFDTSRPIMFVLGKGSRECPADDFIQVLYECPADLLHVIGTFKGSTELQSAKRLFQQRRPEKAVDGTESFFWADTQQNYFLVGRSKAWGWWPQEIESLIKPGELNR
jgi:hypothetical protein